MGVMKTLVTGSAGFIGFHVARELLERGEGLPRTIIEGLAMGLPVVATDAGGTDEIITSEKHGKVIRKESPEELSQATLKYLKNEDLLGKHRKERHKYVKNKFSISSYVRGFEKIVLNETNK